MISKSRSCRQCAWCVSEHLPRLRKNILPGTVKLVEQKLTYYTVAQDPSLCLAWCLLALQHLSVHPESNWYELILFRFAALKLWNSYTVSDFFEHFPCFVFPRSNVPPWKVWHVRQQLVQLPLAGCPWREGEAGYWHNLRPQAMPPEAAAWSPESQQTAHVLTTSSPEQLAIWSLGLSQGKSNIYSAVRKKDHNMFEFSKLILGWITFSKGVTWHQFRARICASLVIWCIRTCL